MGYSFKQIAAEIFYDPYGSPSYGPPYINVTQLPAQVLYDTAIGSSGNKYVYITQLPVQVLYNLYGIYGSVNCFCPGIDNKSGVVDLYTNGSYFANSGIDLYTYGIIPNISGISLYMRGYDTISTIRAASNGLSWYDFTTNLWHTFTASEWDTFISTSISGSLAPDLYTYGAYLSNSGMDLYTIGWDTYTSGCNLYTKGYDIINSGLDLYTIGAYTSNDDIPLYIKVDSAYYAHSGLDLYLYNNQTFSTSGIDLYIQVDGENEGYIPYDDNIPLFLHGEDGELLVNSLNLYCRCALGTINSYTNLYLCGGTIVNSGIDLSIPQTYGVYTNIIKFYTTGY